MYRNSIPATGRVGLSGAVEHRNLSVYLGIIMRLMPHQAKIIRQVISELTEDVVDIRLFGSRLDDGTRGGDIDLLVEFSSPVNEPAWLSAMISGRISRRLGGRKVDVLLGAPNLEHFPIHDIARKEGIAL